MKINFENSVDKLLKTKNQAEYSKLYEPLLKEHQIYQKANNFINNIKAHAYNGDFGAVKQELGNFTTGNFNQIANPLNPNPQAIENIYNGTLKKINDFKPFVDRSIEVAKYSKGPLYFVNNLENYNRPDARQFMDFSLNLPKDTFKTDTYSMIKPIFNQKMNKYLQKLGTDLKVKENMKGIIFEKSSSISQKLSNFEQLQKDIKLNYNPEKQFIRNLGIDTDKNLQYTVGHFTILNPRIENGIFKGTLFDIYDFDKLKKEQFETLEGYIANNGAYWLQKFKFLRNYYFLIPIEFEW